MRYIIQRRDFDPIECNPADLDDYFLEIAEDARPVEGWLIDTEQKTFHELDAQVQAAVEAAQYDAQHIQQESIGSIFL